jgi:phosphoglucosamine mutase
MMDDRLEGGSRLTRLFGTDGIRGEVNQWPLTVDSVLRLGQAMARVIERKRDVRSKVLIGRDPRQSGLMLESALSAGLMSQGVDVMLVGVITTPGVAYLTRVHSVQLGVVISASHNPFSHNGIKVLGPDGFKIPDEMENTIEQFLLDSVVELGRVDVGRLGRSSDVSSWRQIYVDHLVGTWEENCPLQGKRVVLDCANGAASAIAPEVFQRLGAEVVTLEGVPDGLNINENYEYIQPESLRAAVLRERAFAGAAFDGDGDRVVLVDEEGGFVNGDVIMAILARDMKQKGLLTNNTVVCTPMSNWGLKASLEEACIRVEETAVGDRFVLQRMLDEDYCLGGEQAGHIIVLHDGQTTGDGIYTALAVLKAVNASADQRLSVLARCMQEYPECLISIDVPSKPPLESIPEVQAAFRQLQLVLGRDVDITLRYSGTESKLRLKIRAGEEYDRQTLEREAQAFVAVARRAIRSVD